MKLYQTKTSKCLILATLVVLIFLVWNISRDWHWRNNPDAAFKYFTGRVLPSGVHATSYSYAFTDNLLHVTHYWILAGSPDGLRQVTAETGFEKSDDAREVLPDLQRLFGVPWSRENVIAGYEWELARDRWYCIFTGETNALYAH